MTRVRIVTIALVATAALVLSSAATAGAAKTVSLFCFAPNGETRYCLGIFEAKHGIDFRIASKSFTGSYKVCVSDPSGRRVCHRWNLSRFCNCSVKIWEKNFPHALPGRYVVEWRRKGHRLAPNQSFIKPSAR